MLSHYADNFGTLVYEAFFFYKIFALLLSLWGRRLLALVFKQMALTKKLKLIIFVVVTSRKLFLCSTSSAIGP